jgi:hypothetical protein
MTSSAPFIALPGLWFDCARHSTLRSDQFSNQGYAGDGVIRVADVLACRGPRSELRAGSAVPAHCVVSAISFLFTHLADPHLLSVILVPLPALFSLAQCADPYITAAFISSHCTHASTCMHLCSTSVARTSLHTFPTRSILLVYCTFHLD